MAGTRHTRRIVTYWRPEDYERVTRIAAKRGLSLSGLFHSLIGVRPARLGRPPSVARYRDEARHHGRGDAD